MCPIKKVMGIVNEESFAPEVLQAEPLCLLLGSPNTPSSPEPKISQN